MPQGARDGGVAMSGCTVCHKEPGMAVWLIMIADKQEKFAYRFSRHFFYL